MHRHMNVEIGIEAGAIPFLGISRIFVAVCREIKKTILYSSRKHLSAPIKMFLFQMKMTRWRKTKKKEFFR
jgi:hypothetical protein